MKLREAPAWAWLLLATALFAAGYFLGWSHGHRAGMLDECRFLAGAAADCHQT